MLMPDVTAILIDPEVGGGVSFQVKRVTNTRVLGSVRRSETIFDVVGNIQPQDLSVQASTTEDLMNEGIVIRAAFDFRVGENDGGVSFEGEDEVIWNNSVWRVTRVENWIEWGFSTAYATKVMDMAVDNSSTEVVEDVQNGETQSEVAGETQGEG